MSFSLADAAAFAAVKQPVRRPVKSAQRGLLIFHEALNEDRGKVEPIMNILKTKYGSWFIEVRPTPNHPYQIIVNPAYYEEIKGFLDRGGFTAENNQTVKAEQRKDVREALEKKELETTIEANLTDKDALNLSKVSIGISLVAIIVSILISKC